MKALFTKIQSSKLAKLLLFVFAFVLAMPERVARATGYDIVSVASDGTISFSPGSLVVAIITGAIAAVASAAALVVLSIGVRWMYRLVKAK